MTFLDTEMKELCRSIQISTDNTRSLISTPVYVSDILQTEEAFMVKEYIHTHTYIHTHIHNQQILISLYLCLFLANKSYKYFSIIRRETAKMALLNWIVP